MITAEHHEEGGGNCTWSRYGDAALRGVHRGHGAEHRQRRRHRGHARSRRPTSRSPRRPTGLCFRDPAESIRHYYAALDAASDVIVVLSHNGYTDGGYGYGFTVYGDQTLATKLNTPASRST